MVERRRFIVSGRGIRPADDVMAVLQNRYGRFGLDRVACVFGFPQEFSPLYGGRGGRRGWPVVTDDQIRTLRQHDITFDIVLSNHFFSDAAYDQTKPILAKHHVDGNGVVCQNDELARRVRDDFPRYALRSSMIKGLDTAEKVEAALDLYDFVTLPAKHSDDEQLLRGISRKDRVIVFGNAFCAYFCPTTPCYLHMSHAYFDSQYVPQGETCTQTHRTCKYIEFDLDAEMYDGYSFFKLIPPKLKKA